MKDKKWFGKCKKSMLEWTKKKLKLLAGIEILEKRATRRLFRPEAEEIDLFK
jgi:hypothetical protein